MDTRERFLIGIDFIEERLLEPVRLAEVAERAGFSPHHYSRLFRVLTGETFGSYLWRRRLAVAAEQLSCGDQEPRLIDLALQCQYDSQEAFTRAFKRSFGMPPGAFRRSPPSARQHWRRRIDAETLGHLKEVLEMEPEIVELEAFQVVGVRERFDQESKRSIPELWDRFNALESAVRHRTDGRSYGVCLNADPELGSFDYLAGVEVSRVDTLPEGLVAETVPRQTYAVFTHHMKAPPLHDELQGTMRWIWGTWLPEARYEYVPGPDFERYPPGFEPGVEGGFLEIAIPVRASA